jgi:hypothetical protein
MKRLFFAFALTVLVSSFAPQAKSQDVSVDFFYNNINGGSWVEVGNYGYCWQPDVAVSDRSWRPYADGYWAYTDLGWTWVSYEDFGWATYHYGRWVRLSDYGWVWVPGHRWGPAWVSWRFGGGYAGWAPLPPETEVVYESHPLTGQLDIEFDIGPAYYNFVDVRYIGEPVLRSRLVPYEQNVTYVTQTVNVTNITYKNKTVYNYGPDLNTVNQFSSRPVQQLKLERQSNVDVGAAAKSFGLTKVQGNQLVVAAPQEINKTAASAPPPKLKAKVDQPKVEKGWSIAGDENAKNQLKEKIKTQDSNKIPPPNIGGNAAAASGSSAAPAIAGSAFEKGKGKGKGKNKQADQFQAGAGASASPGAAAAMTSAGENATMPEQGQGKGKGKGKNRGADQAQAGAVGSTMTSPGESVAMPEQGQGKGKRKNRAADQSQAGPAGLPMTAPGAESSMSAPPETGKRGKGKRSEQFGGTGPTAAPPTGAEETNQPQGKRKGMQNAGSSPGGPANPPPENFDQPRGKQQQGETLKAPPQVGETGAAKHEGRGRGQGQGQGPATTPTPGPQ